jgi:hypothetical protein
MVATLTNRSARLGRGSQHLVETYGPLKRDGQIGRLRLVRLFARCPPGGISMPHLTLVARYPQVFHQGAVLRFVDPALAGQSPTG